MMDELLELVPSAERRFVRDQVDRLCRDAELPVRHLWHEPVREQIRRVGTVVTAIAPYLPYERLALLVDYARWTLRFDDRLDDPDIDLEMFHKICDAVTAVTLGHPPALPSDPLIRRLSGIVSRLSTFDDAGYAFARFGRALRDTVAAEMDHVVLARAVSSGTRRPPTPRRYLLVATETVNYRSFAYALLALGGEVLSAAALDRLDAPLRQAAYAVRLSNDLRSVGRDLAESNLNVLALSNAEGTRIRPESVRREIGRTVREHHAALTAAGPDLAPAARALIRCLEVSVGLYRSTDLR